MNIGILFDKENNWLRKYFTKKDFEQFKHINIKIEHDIKKINNREIVFILGYTKILSKKDLERNKLNLVIHESKLPENKGFSPVQHQILKGNNNLKISLFIADAKLDNGRILLVSDLKFNGTELYDEIREKQALATKRTIIRFLKNYPKILNKKINIERKETFNKRLSNKNNELNIFKTIDEQFNILRIGNNDKWPSYFYKNGIKYIIKIFKEN